MAQEKKPRDLSNNRELEARILHWERQLRNSLNAVSVAQRMLDKLYLEANEVIEEDTKKS